MSKWEWKKLKDICEIEFGTRVVRKKDGGSIYPVYGGGGATFKMDSFNREDCLIVSRFAMSPQCTRIVKGKFFLNDSGLSLKSKDLSVLSEQYLNSIILGINDDIYALGRGAAQRNLNVEAFKELNIPIPPLSEQKRIVKFLGEEFSKIDTLKTNAETNLKNAKELFETTLEKELNPQSRHSERSEESSAELPSGWEWKKLGDLCETSSGGTPLKQHNEYYENGNIPWLRSGEVCQKEIFETEMYITQKGMENSSAKYFPENSVVVAMYGATAGQVGIVRFRTTTNQAVCGIFPNEKYKTEYLYYALLSKKKELVAQAVGGAQPNISQIKIRSLVVPLPPLSVQKEIVSRLDKLSENVKRLEANYKQIIANCDELKKSILKQTFQGGN